MVWLSLLFPCPISLPHDEGGKEQMSTPLELICPCESQGNTKMLVPKPSVSGYTSSICVLYLHLNLTLCSNGEL